MAVELRAATPADLAAISALREAAAPAFLFDAGVPSGVLLELCACSVAVSEYGGLLGLVCVASAFPGLDAPAVIGDVQLLVEDALFAPGNTALLCCAAVSESADGGAAGAAALARSLLVHALQPLPEVEHLLVVAPAAAGLAEYSLASGAGAPLQALGCVRTPLAVEGARALYLLPSPSPPLLVRPARVEDFDDLAPIFEAQSEVVKGTFGEYFLAEAIEGAERAPESRRVLVGERGGRAVGLLSVTAGVPVHPMQRNFYTEPFGRLLAPSAAEAEGAARAARAAARASCDWLQLLRDHAEELPFLFGTLPCAEAPAEAPAEGAAAPWAGAAPSSHPPEGDPLCWFGEQDGADTEATVELSAVAELLNSVGDAWGFAGPNGAQLGTMVLVDTGLAPAGPSSGASNAAFSITRSALAAAIGAVSRSRDALACLARLAAWYAPASAPGWGARALAEEWERAAASVDGARKERFKALQLANSAAQKEADAAATAERNVCDAAAKEQYEREKAEKEKREGKPAKAGKPVNVASLPVPSTPAVLAAREAKAAADGRAEAAAAAMLAAQAAVSVPITLTLEALASSLATNASLASPSGMAPPVRELLRELTPLVKPAAPELSAKDLSALLRAWEAARLALCLHPSIMVSSATGEGHALTVPAKDAAVPAADAGEAGVAAAAAAALRAPCFHLPALVAEAASAYAAAAAALAEATARFAAAEEKRRSAEAEAAKAKEKGQPPPPAAKLEPPKGPTPAAAQAALDRLCDPLVDPLKGVTAYLTSGKVDISRGAVFTGLPVHDASACGRLADALAGVGLPCALHLHAETLGAPKRFVTGGVTGTGKGRRPSVAPSAPVLLTAAPAPGALGALRHVSAEAGHLQRVAAGAAGAAGEGEGKARPHAERLAGLVALEVEALLGQFSLGVAGEGAGGQGGGARDGDFFPSIHAPDSEPSAALAVDLFCLHADCDARTGDLLAAAFAEFPAMHYAVLAQPHVSVLPPLARHFMQAAPRPHSELNTALFVSPRASLDVSLHMTVRRALPSDRATLFRLAAHFAEADAADFRHCVVASEQRAWQHLGGAGGSAAQGGSAARIACFVAEVRGQVVGVAVLSNSGGSARALAAAAASFDLSGLLDTAVHAREQGAEPGVASLLHAHVDSAFVQATPLFFRQALSLYGGKHALLYRRRPGSAGAHVAGSLTPAILHACTVAAPRHLPELPPAKARARAAAAEEDARASADAATDWGACDPVTAAPFLVAGAPEHLLWDAHNLAHALYVFSGRLSMAARPVCNERVLVLGSGDAAVAALARLLWSPAPRLPHLTLITGPAGLAAATDPYASPAPFAAARELSAFDLSRMPVTAHVGVRADDLVRIRRKERVVVLASGSSEAHLRYDRLVLLPDLVEPTAANLGLPSCRALPPGMHAVGGGVDARGAAALETAVAVLAANLAQQQGGGGEAAAAGGGLLGGGVGGFDGGSRLLETSGEDLDLLLRSNSPPLESALPSPASLHGCVLVYGDTLEAVAALSALLDRGVPGASIVAVLPPPLPAAAGGAGVQVAEEDLAAALAPGSAPLAPAELHAGLLPPPPHTPAALFPAVTLATLLRNAGVRTLPHALLTAAASAGVPGLDRALSVTLSVGGRALSVRPALLLCCDEQQVPASFFAAVNDCGIVFDGRLVVDEHFCATDGAVLGGGAAAKFTRRLRAAAPLCEHSAVETGGAVADSLLRGLGFSLPHQQRLPPPGLIRARTLRCALPGGIVYSRSKVAAYEMGGSGREASTHVTDAYGALSQHTRAVVDRYGYLAEVCVVGAEPVETRNLARLPGLHSAFLSGLVRRAEAERAGYAAGGFPAGDMVTFFREDWAEALYEEAFAPFALGLRGALDGDASVEALCASVQGMLAGAGSGDKEVDDIVDAACAEAVAGGVGVGGRALGEEAQRRVEAEVRAFLARR